MKNIPQIYKLILLSKLARKMHFLDPAEENKQLNHLNDLLSDANICPDAQENCYYFPINYPPKSNRLWIQFYMKRKYS